MKRIFGAFGALVLIGTSVLVFSSSESAQATTPAVSAYGDVGIDQVVAHGDDDLTLLSCLAGTSTNISNNVYGGIESNIDGYANNGTFGCEPRSGNNPDNDVTGPDGTVYGSHIVYAATVTRYLEAERNGSLVWSVPINLSNECPGGSTDPTSPTSMSVGSDGNLYMKVNIGGCETYLLGVNSKTGAVIVQIELGQASGKITPNVWTFSDKIIAVNSSGEILQYGYGPDYTHFTGTNSGHLFPSTVYGSTMADSAGDVYLIALNGNIYEYSAAGVSTMADGRGADFYALGRTGHILNYSDGGSVYDINIADNTVVGYTPPVPSGYVKSQTYFSNPYVVSDANGNILDVLQLTQSGTGYAAVDVVYIDASTGVPVSIYMLTGNSSSTEGNAIVGSSDVFGEYMYVPITYGTTWGSPAVPNSHISKINVAEYGFGDVRRTVNGFDPFTDASIKYVAMGDSYASGEGNGPFILGTDELSFNECHRSKNAYPLQLGKDTSLNLNLTSFPACSGAVESNILGINSTNPTEGPQVYPVVPGDTNLITISIGGNDAGFPDAITSCAMKQDEPSADTRTQEEYDQSVCASALADSASTISATSFTTNLTMLYNSIASAAGPSTRVLVIGYPQLFPVYSNISGDCTWGIGVTNNLGVTDGRNVSPDEVSTIRDLDTQLNTVISNAVTGTNNSNIQFLSVASAFSGHEECTTDPWFNFIELGTIDEVLNPAGSFHPNVEGMNAYKSVIASKIESMTF